MSVSPDAIGPGHYLGTELGGKWWKRYRALGYFARGNGTFVFADGELVFHRALTKELTRIPFALVTGVSIGTWHAGTWLAGKPVVKVAWTKDGQELSSGFGFSSLEQAQSFADRIRSGLGRPLA
jgi:hypothetical protein